MGPELIGAYAVILDIIYARAGDMPRDDRHLAGVLGCSIRKARALTDALVERGKIQIVGGKIRNFRADEVIETRRKQRETTVKPTRSDGEKGLASNENKGLSLKIRREENITPLTPLRGGRGRKFGVPESVKKLVNGDDR